MDWHDRMKIAREDAGFTQKEMAQRLGMHPRTYAAYERGERDIVTKDLLKFCVDLDVSADWLLGTNNHSTPADSKSAVLKDVEEKLSIMSDKELNSVRREVDIRLTKSSIKK